ncbi:MAG: type IV toxin-antitoxin system AbiEi family antitoxin domain-containing protein [Lachnospiraceae bacterium]|nr:type IV toxin-antitoxin system AbiEi family antitoxin domain-containing protein [Lachnospiraceae bacterium]
MKLLVRDKLQSLADENNGYLLTSDVVAAGISKTYLAQFVQENAMERVAQGVYLSPAGWRDDYYILFLANQKIIFSHESALYLHDMADREPPHVSVTVRAGYNATHLRKKGVKVYQVKPDMIDVGVSRVKTNMGNEVAAYGRERTICDIVRYHDDMDSQTFQMAMKEYMRQRNRDLNLLMKYAALFGIEKEMKNYVEVLA